MLWSLQWVKNQWAARVASLDQVAVARLCPSTKPPALLQPNHNTPCCWLRGAVVVLATVQQTSRVWTQWWAPQGHTAGLPAKRWLWLQLVVVAGPVLRQQGQLATSMVVVLVVLVLWAMGLILRRLIPWVGNPF
jgi:hypothetical protein